MIVSALLLLQIAGAGMPAAKENALTDSVVAAELRFFSRWADAWRLSEAEQRKRPKPQRGDPTYYAFPWWLTQQDALCHREGPRFLVAHDDYKLPYMIVDGVRRIESAHSWLSVCPGWFRDPGEASGDERLGLDSALTQLQRDSVRGSRSRLIGVLESAAGADTSDGFLAGQHIRLLVDQGDFTTATRAARNCKAESWWCTALAGYVLAASGDLAAADSAFRASREKMIGEVRCKWDEIGALLEEADRKKYAALSCAEREPLNARIWWLADPLYAERGNARRVEQFVRQMQVALRSAVFRDERRDWRNEKGGDALREMLARYGWPAYSARWSINWYGSRLYSPAVEFLLRGQPIPEPRTSYEYSHDRVHLVPGQRLLDKPFGSQLGDWNFSPPANMAEEGKVWWPREHSSLQYSLVPLADVQSAMLRRDRGVLFAVATDLDPTLLRRRVTESVGAALVVSPGPDSVQIVERKPAIVGTTAMLRGLIQPQPYVAGFEILPAELRRAPAARARFGIEPPQALSAMKPGELAISAPIILRDPVNDDIPSPDPDSALGRMAGSTTVSSKRLGIYWETYGFQPTDSVELSVWIERYTPQGLLHRLGNTLGVAQDMNTPVVVTWMEPQPGKQTYTITGNVAITGRSVVLDVSALPKGDYWLDVGARRPGGVPVHGRRSFTIK